MARYWIGVVSREHVMNGVAGGFIQLNHGKKEALKRMAAGDWLVYYSPRLSFGGDTPCQAFTALCQVSDDEIYQVTMEDGFRPFRRNVRFLPVHDAPIQLLVHKLSFIRDPQRWGYPFRTGHFAITQADFEIIASAMGADALSFAG